MERFFPYTKVYDSESNNMNTSIYMNALSPGQRGTVRDIRHTGEMRRRLQDIGLIRGTPVECVGRSPLGDPAAYRIRGAVIALRDRDTALIGITPLSPWD